MKVILWHLSSVDFKQRRFPSITWVGLIGFKALAAKTEVSQRNSAWRLQHQLLHEFLACGPARSFSTLPTSYSHLSQFLKINLLIYVHILYLTVSPENPDWYSSPEEGLAKNHNWMGVMWLSHTLLLESPFSNPSALRLVSTSTMRLLGILSLSLCIFSPPLSLKMWTPWLLPDPRSWSRSLATCSCSVPHCTSVVQAPSQVFPRALFPELRSDPNHPHNFLPLSFT